MRKPRILFISAVHPWQYTPLAEFLHSHGLAECWQMTTPGHQKTYHQTNTNVIAFTPTGPIVGKPDNVLLWKLQRSTHIAKGVHDAVANLPPEQKPDLIVAHSMWGGPHFLFDTFKIPVITYMEFPSYKAHGYDLRYPPDRSQHLADANMEMITFHQLARSAMTIVPSHFAKTLVPESLRARVEVQFEGFKDPVRFQPKAPRTDGLKIGFTARDLSNAKGVDRFIAMAARLIDQGNAHDLGFVAIGDPKAATYSYEPQAVKRLHKNEEMTYVEHLLLDSPSARAIEFIGKQPYDAYVALMESIDIFAYPLRHGVANWGFVEILMRGGCIVATNSTFLPEIISDGVNGRLVGDDPAELAATVEELAADPAQRARLSDAAFQSGRQFALDVVGPRFMALFKQAIDLGNQY